MIWLCTELWESNQCPEHERNKKTLVYCMLIPTDQMLTDGCDGSLPTYRLLDPALFPALYPITQLLFKWHVQPCNAACRSPLAADHLFFETSPICERGACVTYLCSMGPAERIASPHHIFDALHFLLVAVAVLHGSLLRLLQCTLQRLNSLSCRSKTFLQLWKLTAKICIVTYQLSHTHTHTHTNSMPKD